jgi:magnesium transporter
MMKTSMAKATPIHNHKSEESTLGFCAIHSKTLTKSIHSNNVEDFATFIEPSAITWIDYIVDDVRKESSEIASKLGFSEEMISHTIMNLGDASRARGSYEDFDTEMLLVLPMMHLDGFEVTIKPLFILIKKNTVMTIRTKELTQYNQLRRYAETYLKKLPEDLNNNDWLTLLLIRLLDENNSRNYDQLQEVEMAGDSLGMDLADAKTPRYSLGSRIYKMKHALILYLSGLWATVDVLYSLRYGDADLLSDNQMVLNQIVRMVGEVHSQIGISEDLSHVLASGLEVLQSIYNNQLQLLNNRITLLVGYLTIIGTALLVPNTIATVAGNSSFSYSKIGQYWYMALIIVSTLIATLISWLAVKRMGLLPRSSDVPPDNSKN